MICFKIRDTKTGKYWDGRRYSTGFNASGKEWKTKKSAFRALEYFINYSARWGGNKSPDATDVSTWEIVEVEYTPSEKSTESLKDYSNFSKIRAELSKTSNKVAYFADNMFRKGVFDKIEYILVLKTNPKTYGADMQTIKEGRAALRQLGVKTRTFRESYGIFGMMDRQQALKARMVLDVDAAIDVAEIRKNLGL